MNRTVGDGSDIASVAALLGDASRAAMVTALMDGLRLPATELARIAGVSKSTASEHLARLVDSGLLDTERCGRHTYYRVADPLVGRALEALAVIAPQRRPNSLRSVRRHEELGRARLCYDHLAGHLGVAVTDALRQRGLLYERDAALEVDQAAWDAHVPLDVTCDAARKGRRPLARGCVDWTVRRHHLAGALGAKLAARMFDLGWIQRRREKERAIVVTDVGLHGMREVFDFDDSTLQALAPA
ncbi:ArsR family transcriptional regulator [Nocardiopsis gilva YIM 90087]|uniref:ArsR family transcriptional regulator n=1 Tax=Nocardiopsis gilva YIM 90087 TaxID=1235441 RepID=A0A223SD43_9ACTN|nr:winged helix-turn-helix domain-containing protein [Nocardiopsis gilva]ASU86015.1 ArsR family transcriptional regulator [Nocardiopsis gilva YIM 90087]